MLRADEGLMLRCWLKNLMHQYAIQRRRDKHVSPVDSFERQHFSPSYAHRAANVPILPALNQIHERGKCQQETNCQSYKGRHVDLGHIDCF
jgi:hypothetical protein